MKPTIGRIVIYNTTEEEQKAMRDAVVPNNSNDQKRLPAVIVAVWGETTINAKVFIDGNYSDLWKCSVIQGDGPGQWNWPVIEK